MQRINSNQTIRLVLSLCLLAGCQSRQTADLRLAGEVHLQALHVLGQLETALDSLAQAGALPADTLAAVQRDLQAWRESLVEVPGMEHDHAHPEHEHHDSPPPDISDQDMLRIQQDALARVRALQARVQAAAPPL